MTDPDPNPFADCDAITCYGGAKLFDKHLGLDDSLRRQRDYLLAATP
jgi:hypothetical protein